MRVNDADEDVEHLLKDYFTFEVNVQIHATL